MFLKLNATAFFLAALAVPVAAAASGPAPRHDPSRDQRAGQAPRADRQAPVELICRSVAIAGDSESTPMVCMTAADWRRAEQ